MPTKSSKMKQNKKQLTELFVFVFDYLDVFI